MKRFSPESAETPDYRGEQRLKGTSLSCPMGFERNPRLEFLETTKLSSTFTSLLRFPKRRQESQLASAPGDRTNSCSPFRSSSFWTTFANLSGPLRRSRILTLRLGFPTDAGHNDFVFSFWFRFSRRRFQAASCARLPWGHFGACGLDGAGGARLRQPDGRPEEHDRFAHERIG